MENTDKIITEETNLVIPEHVALILDGNGRWAKKRGLPRTETGYKVSDRVWFFNRELETLRRGSGSADAVVPLLSETAFKNCKIK